MKWKCFICDKKEEGDLNDFHKHYMEEHYGNSRKDSGTDTQSQRLDVREMWHRIKSPLVDPSPQATRHGGNKKQNDSLPSKPSASLW